MENNLHKAHKENIALAEEVIETGKIPDIVDSTREFFEPDEYEMQKEIEQAITQSELNILQEIEKWAEEEIKKAFSKEVFDSNAFAYLGGGVNVLKDLLTHIKEVKELINKEI